MTIVPFDPQDTLPYYEEYYTRQTGGGGVYAGRPIMDMRGAGIGAFLGKMVKRAAPVLLNVAKTVGRHAVDVAREALDGGDATQSANRGPRSAGGEILDDVYDVVADNGRRSSRRQSAPKRRSATRGGGRAKRRRRGDVGIPLDG
jgi:hypothetical protein